MLLSLYYDIKDKISLNTSNLTYKRLSLISNRNIYNRKILTVRGYLIIVNIVFFNYA